VNKPPGLGRRRVKLALDGEVRVVTLPLEFRISSKPLWLIRPAHPAGAS